MQFYILDGKTPVKATMEESAKFMDSAGSNRMVANTDISPTVELSTVFLGMDHGRDDSDSPLLFETMIFRDNNGTEQWRFATWEQAEAFHHKKVRELRR